MSENYTDKLFHNRYRLVEKKGRGSFAEVWLARDTELDLDVAIKIYISLDDNGVNDFKEEFRTSWAMNHPNLLHAYYYEIDNNCPFLVMPYCPVKSESLVGTADEKEVWKFIRDVSAGLAYIHEMDVVHNDIKPDNILRNAAGTYMITDFGISKKMRSTLRKNSMRQMTDSNEIGGGSPSYMAPELFSATPDAVKATDIWALGVTLYEIVTGSLPFFGQGGGMLLHGAELPKIDANVSKDLKDLITACLQKDTWDRPTAQQLNETAKAKLEGRAVQLSRKASKFQKRSVRKSKKKSDSEIQAKKKERRAKRTVILKKVSRVLVYIMPVLIVFCILFFSLRNHFRAHRDLEEYNTLVEQCERVINSEKPSILLLRGKPLITDLWSISDYEEKYGRINKHYNNYQLLESAREKKIDEIEELARQWAEAADAQIRIGRKENIDKAFEFYYTSLSIDDNSEVRARFENQAAKYAYIKPVEIELRGEGNYNETLYADKIKYLYTRLKYERLDPTNPHNVRLIVKIYNNGKLKYNSSEYSSSYTFHSDITVKAEGGVNSVFLLGWGSETAGAVYSKGSLRVEIWCGDKKLITKETTIY